MKRAIFAILVTVVAAGAGCSSAPPECDDGTCLAIEQAGPTAIAVDGTNVYWTNAGHVDRPRRA